MLRKLRATDWLSDCCVAKCCGKYCVFSYFHVSHVSSRIRSFKNTNPTNLTNIFSYLHAYCLMRNLFVPICAIRVQKKSASIRAIRGDNLPAFFVSFERFVFKK